MWLMSALSKTGPVGAGAAGSQAQKALPRYGRERCQVAQALPGESGMGSTERSDDDMSSVDAMSLDD